tara:strand:+ start:3891 stop:4139 length:249 start_codon:yes stop_codon:yes gene_type:complete
MITEEQIIEILKSYSTYTDRSRTDECVHESNFDLIAKDVVKKLTIPVVVGMLVCDIEKGTRCKDSFANYRDGVCYVCGGQAN